MKRKTKIKVTLLILLLIFNIFGIYQSFVECFIDYDIEQQTVRIVDKLYMHSKTSKTCYMYGEDTDGNRYKIPGDTADVSDVISIYINPNSANAQGSDPQWCTNPKQVRINSIIGIILFGILTSVNIILLLRLRRTT